MKKIITILCVTIAVFGLPMDISAIELLTAAQDSAPKYFKDNGMDGLCIEIMNAIEKVNSSIKFIGHETFLPFKRIQKNLEEGKIDVFFGFAKSKEREEKYTFVDPPLYKMRLVAAVRKDDDISIQSFVDIRLLGENGKILTIFGTNTDAFLKKQGGLIIDDGGKEVPSNLRKLIEKRGRFVFYHELGLVSSIKNKGLENRVKILPTTFREYYHYAAFSKQAPNSDVIKVESALEILKSNGELEKIFHKYQSLK